MQGHLWSSSRICPWAATVLIYVNDSVKETTLDGNSITTYYVVVIQPTEDFSCVQEGINNIGHWVEGNYLKLNSSKCKFMAWWYQGAEVAGAAQVPVLKLAIWSSTAKSL